MNRRDWRRAKNTTLARWDELLGCDYVMGNRFLGDPPTGDCRGYYDEGFRAAGTLEAIGGESQNVRHMYAKNKAAGRLRDASVTPGPTWGAIYNEPAMVGKDPSNPLAIRHIAPVIEPPSADYPNGLCSSALNPALGVREHTLMPLSVVNDKGKTLTFSNLAVLAFIKPDRTLVGASSVPIADPEPPIS